MRVRITRNTIAGGVPVAAGDVLDVSPSDARVLLALRKAEPFELPAGDDRPPVLTTGAPEAAALVATENAALPSAKPRARRKE